MIIGQEMLVDTYDASLAFLTLCQTASPLLIDRFLKTKNTLTEREFMSSF